jgi:hypothetical protein
MAAICLELPGGNIMKAPYWAVGCMLMLGIAEALWADDPSGFTTPSPAVTPLARPISSSASPLNYAAQNGAAIDPNSQAPAQAAGSSNSVNNLRYPVIAPAPTNTPNTNGGNALSIGPAPVQSNTVPAPFNSSAGAVPVPTQASGAMATANAQMAEPSNPSGAAERSPDGTTSVKTNPWRPVQTTFRQLTKSSEVKPAAQSNVVAQNGTPLYPPQNPPSPPMRVDGVQPSTTVVEEPERPFARSARLGDGPPGEIVYGGPPNGGGCGCGGGGSCGSPGDSLICPNCGGWQPGTCRGKYPDGSCICQRLACCLCKPYPDCSNGCVDFCHSWLWHEDDCWLTSNHKCCNGNCGPYPYGNCPNDGMGKGNGCGCGNCGPCVPAPDLYFSAEALTFSRHDNLGAQSLAEIGGTSILGTQDLGFDSEWVTGPRFVLGYSPTQKDAWELSYFGLQHWQDAQSVTNAGGLLGLPGDLGLLTEFSGARLLQATYSSEIHDAELNYSWHHCCNALSWIAGFRYFRLDDELDLTSTVTGTGLGAYNVRAVNDLYGGQLGARFNVCCHQFQWDCTAKAGAFGNDIESIQFAGPVGGMTVRDTRVFESHWAFVGEFSSNVSYYFCKNWCATAGFNVLWLDGVAFAPDQLDFTNTPTSGTAVNHDGNAMYVGGHVGVGVRF